MKFEKAIQLLHEFDYEKNGVDDTIFFLQIIINELVKQYKKEK